MEAPTRRGSHGRCHGRWRARTAKALRTIPGASEHPWIGCLPSSGGSTARRYRPDCSASQPSSICRVMSQTELDGGAVSCVLALGCSHAPALPTTNGPQCRLAGSSLWAIAGVHSTARPTPAPGRYQASRPATTRRSRWQSTKAESRGLFGRRCRPGREQPGSPLSAPRSMRPEKRGSGAADHCPVLPPAVAAWRNGQLGGQRGGVGGDRAAASVAAEADRTISPRSHPHTP
jgi:hypothetical protein